MSDNAVEFRNFLNESLPLFRKRLESRMIPHIAPLFQLSRDKLAAISEEARSVNSAIDLIGAVVMAVPNFLSPIQLGDSLLSAIQVDMTGSGKHFDALIASVAKRVPTTNLLPVVCSLWPKLLDSADYVSHSITAAKQRVLTRIFDQPRLCKSISDSCRGLSVTPVELPCPHWSRRSSPFSLMPLTSATTRRIRT